MAKSKAKSKKATRLLVVVLLVVVIVVVIAAAYVITSLALGNQWNPVKWGKGNDVATEQPQNKTEVVAITSDGKKLLTANSYVMPRAMAFVNKQSTYSKSKEFTVTASLSNKYINGKFDWAVSFVNPASEWATGKVAEYYVQVIPTADGSATATVKYISTFSEQIQITATLRGSDSSDTCTVDCLKQIDSSDCWTDAMDFGDNLEGGMSLYSSSGTVFADYEVWYVRYDVDGNFVEAVQNYLKFDIELHNYEFTGLIADTPLGIEEQTNTHLQLSFNAKHTLAYSDFIENFEAFDDEHKEAIYYAWYRAAAELGYGVQFEMGVCAYVNGTDTSVKESNGKTYSLVVSGERFGKGVQPSVTLNQNIVVY